MPDLGNPFFLGIPDENARFGSVPVSDSGRKWKFSAPGSSENRGASDRPFHEGFPVNLHAPSDKRQKTPSYGRLPAIARPVKGIFRQDSQRNRTFSESDLDVHLETLDLD